MGGEAFLTDTVLVTGVNGFVGQPLCKRLVSEGLKVVGTVRAKERTSEVPSGVDAVPIGLIGPDTDWSKALDGIDTVVHLAARVHVMNDTVADPLAAFRQVNVAGTEKLARMAANVGVRRFIYISSIKVNGENTGLRTEGRGLSFSEEDAPAPQDLYGISKWEAEQTLNHIATETGLEVVILRPPLVYGPYVKANFLRLLKLTKLGLTLPFGGLCNQRSMIYVENLVDAIMTCLEHPEAAGETFFVSDGVDISTSQLIRMIASSMGKKPMFMPFPPILLNMLGKVTGKSAEVERLTGSLCMDSSKIRRILDWEPPFTMEEGIRETVRWFAESSYNS